MALKIWTFLLVMSLPAAERGRSFGSLAAIVLRNIDYQQIQQKLFSHNDIGDGDSKIIRPAVPQTLWWTGHRVDKRAAPNPKITNKNPFAAAASSLTPSADGRCMARVQSALGEMMSSATSTKNGNRRHTAVPQPPSGFMDLSGYALHQRLRTAPGAEMYVTGMRAKVMPPHDAATAESSPNGGDTGGFSGGAGGDRSWARVDGCRYDPLGNTLEARMRFGSTLMVSGSVRLLYGSGSGGGVGETGCDMTLRLRPRAGLGFTAAPLTVPEKSPPNRLTAMPTMTIRTTATFIDPEPVDDPAAAYVSVHSYNCVGGAAGYPGNRERPVATAASSDRYEQFLSSELGGGVSDELLLSAGGDTDVDVDDSGAESGGSSDERSGRRPSSPAPSSSSSSASDETAPADNHSVTDNFPFVSAGFVSPPAPSPEPRLRRIQYHNKPPQHPLLTIATGPAATNNPHHQQAQDQLLMEMEDVFVRGVRSLLAKHMERTLKPVLKDSLMANMGYTVSYG
ncbi:hypothetical protein ACI65C_005630 [Semiaphis heraclei]